MSSFKKLVIKELKHETTTCVSLLFNVPDELKSYYEFFAGQYVTLKIVLNGEELRRAYSICSSPESGELRIAIKAIESGNFSKFANTELKEGDILEVGKPEGKFVFIPISGRQKNYAAFVAGSGITPALSILKSVLESEPKSTFVLVYGNKSPEETIFYKEINDLKSKYDNRLFVYYVFSQVKIEDELYGRIAKSTVDFVLKDKHKNTPFEQFYLCGPEEMINTVSAELKENNIPDSAIKYELFSSTKENSTSEGLNGTTKVTILLDDEETIFEMQQNQTLLEAALKQGLDAPYSCQGGYCCSCMARITSGSAQMKKNTSLNEKEIAEGLILTCQAYPTSDTIYVGFDTV